MNFKGKSTVDCIISFAPAIEDASNIRACIYTMGQSEAIDKIVFNRTKGAKLNIQLSNFVSDSSTQVLKRTSQCDPNPYLRNNMVRCLDGSKHMTHYPIKPDTPDFVQRIFQKAGRIIFTKTQHGGYMVATAVTCEIRKLSNGEYSILADSVKPVKWIRGMRLDMFKEQLRGVKRAKEYAKQKAEEKERLSA